MMCLSGCSRLWICGIALLISTTSASTREALHVTVSIAPQKYFVERIGGDHVAVSVMVPAGSSPHTFDPKPQQLVHLSKSRIYFAIGVTFEHAWLERFKSVNPDMHIIYTDTGIQKVPSTEHDHSGQSGIHQKIPDPHIWLSPPLAIVQAHNIFTALVQSDPANSDLYSDRFKKLVGEITELDCELTQLFSSHSKRNKFMVFHPSWGYFARAYGLEQIPVEIEGKEPKPADLKRLIIIAKEHGIRTIFVQPQFSQENARTFADEIDGRIVVADPLAENWLENLRSVAKIFKAALR